MTGPAVSLRQARPEDTPFLEEMCYVAAFSVDGEIPVGAPSFEGAKKLDWFPSYTKAWGRKGDFGLIAIDADGKNIGAAWYRAYPSDEWPDQLSIGVKKDHQQKGVGEVLLKVLIGHAHEDGIREIALQVNPANTRATRLYAKLGFVAAGEHDGNTLMKAPTSLSTQLK